MDSFTTDFHRSKEPSIMSFFFPCIPWDSFPISDDNATRENADKPRQTLNLSDSINFCSMAGWRKWVCFMPCYSSLPGWTIRLVSFQFITLTLQTELFNYASRIKMGHVRRLRTQAGVISVINSSLWGWIMDNLIVLFANTADCTTIYMMYL